MVVFTDLFNIADLSLPRADKGLEGYGWMLVFSIYHRLVLALIRQSAQSVRTAILLDLLRISPP